MTVVPVAYPTTPSAETPSYTPTAHNLYQPILYTSEQYNPPSAPNGQVPQYINYPVGYSYPYNGTNKFQTLLLRRRHSRINLLNL